MGCTENKAVRAPEVIRNIPEEAFSAESRLVLGKYRMIVGRPGILGEGASSVCHYGTNTRTGESVAIKVYKRSEAKSKQAGQDEEKDTEENEIKFQRQIKVLKELQKAFNPDHFAGDGKARILNSNPRSLCSTDRLLTQQPPGEVHRDRSRAVHAEVCAPIALHSKDHVEERSDTTRGSGHCPCTWGLT